MSESVTALGVDLDSYYDMDIKFLFEKPDLNKKIILNLEPLTAISMSSQLPGSYYKSETEPTKFMLCGLFENILDLHIDNKLRLKILKDLKIRIKKDFNFILSTPKSLSQFLPLTYHLFEIENIIIPENKKFDDLWTQHLKGADKRHLNGSRSNDWDLSKDMYKLKDSDKDKFYKNNEGKFPLYYCSPKPREFIIFKSSLMICLNINESIFNILKTKLLETNIGYLGTNEGWVNIQMEET